MCDGWCWRKIFSKITVGNSPAPRMKGGKALENKPPTFSANADISIAHFLTIAPTGRGREYCSDKSNPIRKSLSVWCGGPPPWSKSTTSYCIPGHSQACWMWSWQTSNESLLTIRKLKLIIKSTVPKWVFDKDLKAFELLFSSGWSFEAISRDVQDRCALDLLQKF